MGCLCIATKAVYSVALFIFFSDKPISEFREILFLLGNGSFFFSPVGLHSSKTEFKTMN